MVEFSFISKCKCKDVFLTCCTHQNILFDFACCGEKAGFGDLVDWEGNQSPKFKIKIIKDGDNQTQKVKNNFFADSSQCKSKSKSEYAEGNGKLLL